MANFSQLRRRQSSREILYRRQFSQEFDDIHLAHLAEQEAAAAAAGVTGVTAAGAEELGLGERSRHHSGHATRHALERQASQAAAAAGAAGDHADPDELGTLMWEMRPRYATSAGELKRKYKKERRATMEKEKQESIKRKNKIRIAEVVVEEEEESVAAAAVKPESPVAAAAATDIPASKLLQVAPEGGPSRVSSVSQFSQPPEEGHEVRESWDSKLTFILATIGYAVGLGNVWRFPYLAQKNGGGAFLIPYTLMLFAQGLPIFYLELAIGQRLRKGSIGVWKQVSPYLGGIGVASGVVSFNVALYYNTIIAWCLFYFVRSFEYPLPWSDCPDIPPDVTDTIANVSSAMKNAECLASSPTHYFWYRETLDVSGDIETADNFNWRIALCLLTAWTLVYLCMIKGITENPKIVYITAIYPYLVLVVFFFRAVTLEGMSDGLVHLFSPKWERLADPVVWLEAGTQIFFSLGLAFGGLIAYASYNPVNNNVTSDALIVALTNCGTSLFAGIVIFAIMGFKANVIHKECLANLNSTLLELFGTAEGVDLSSEGIARWNGLERIVPICSLQNELDNSASGTGLAFILFTEAVNQFPMGNVWAVLFFLMLFTLGLDSQFGTIQGVMQCIVDMKLMPGLRKEILIGLICGTCLVISMIFSHGAGNYVFTLFDNFSGSVPLLVIALFECLGISYVYGLKRFSDDIELMTGNRPHKYWLICWKFVAPVCMMSILFASVVDMALSGAGYEAWDAVKGHTKKEEWPHWGQALIAFLICVSVLWIPLVALLQLCGITFTFLRPELAGWFPAEELRAHYELTEHKVTPAERLLFGFREDGSEGLVCPTFPKDHALKKQPVFANLDPDDE